MLKDDLVREIQKPEYQSICKKLLPAYWNDLYQELSLTILEYNTAKIERIPDITQAKYFIVGILCRMVHSTTSPFYIKYRKPLPVMDSDTYEPDDRIEKVLQEFEKEDWFDKRLVDLYIQHGSFMEIQRKEGINYQFARRSVNRTIDKIKYKMNPIKILMICHEKNGLYFHRQMIPHARLQQLNKEQVFITEMWAEKEVVDGKNKTYEATIDGMTDEQLSKFNIVYYLRQISFRNDKGIPAATVERCKRLGIKVVLDIDDIWHLPSSHHMAPTYKNLKIREEIEQTLPLVDHIITTTDYFADIIKKFNENVTVLPNCIHPEDNQFKSREVSNSRLRFGWIGGIYHYRDIQMIESNFCKLHKDKESRDKYQICLGGFNVSNSGNNEYVGIEQVMTCNYEFKHYDSTYANYLFTYTPTMEHISYDKSYRRLWAKDIMSYGELYNDIDVALIPLEENKFSSCKSELKIVEAGWMGKAVIVSDVSPYAKWIEHGVNGIKIKPSRNSIDWYIEMRKLIKDPDKAKEMGANLQKTIKKHFNLDKHNERRMSLYKELIG